MPSPDEFEWFVLPLNPVGWRVGPLSLGRGRGGKLYPMIGPDAELVAYQEAVRDEFFQRYGRVSMIDGLVELVFFFSQILEEHFTATGRRSRKKAADVTNLQKATEDAIQGVLITNDANVRKITSHVENGTSGVPMVVIGVRKYHGFNPNDLPEHVWFAMTELQKSELATHRPQAVYDWKAEEGPF